MDAHGSQGTGGSADEGVVCARLRAVAATAVWQGRALRWDELWELAKQLGPDPELAHLDDRCLEREVRGHAAELAAMTGRWLDLVGELVVRGIWADHGARTPGQWLSYMVGLGAGTAREHVRVALRLRELPRIRARLREGTISYSKVRAMTRIAVPELEELLLAWADNATAADMERIASSFANYRRGVQPTPEEQAARYGLTLAVEDEFTATITLRMPVDEALTFRAEAERLAELEADCADPAASVAAMLPAASADPVAAEVAIAVRGDLPDAAAPLDALAPSAQPRGQALVGVVQRSLRAAVDHGPADSSGADRTTLVLHVPAAALATPDGFGSVAEQPELAARVDGHGHDVTRASGTDGGPTAGTLIATSGVPAGTATSAPGVSAGTCSASGVSAGTTTSVSGVSAGTPPAALDVSPAPESAPGVSAGTSSSTGGCSSVPPGVAAGRRARPLLVDDGAGRAAVLSPRVLRRLACDAGLVLVAEEDDGRPLDVGRRSRQLTTQLRRAVLARDRTCRFPSCTEHRHLHVHHVHHWADGGATDLDNLLTLCAAHHRFVHEHGWTIELPLAGAARFLAPDGRVFDRTPPPIAVFPDEYRLAPPPDDLGRPTGPRSAPDVEHLRTGPGYDPRGFDLDLAISVLAHELLRVLPDAVLAA